MLTPDFSQYEHTGAYAEHYVQAALDALSAHVALLDESGTIIAVNASWRRFADENQLYSANYGIGTNYLQVCDESTGRNSKEAPIVARAIRDILAGRRDEFMLEYPCHSKYDRRWFIVQITRFMWDDAPRLVLAHQNITQLKTVQLALDESHKRIETILENVASGIVTISARGKLESINPAAAAMFGCDPQALIGEPITTLFAEPQRALAPYKLMQALAHENQPEMTGQRADGTQFPMVFAVNEIHVGSRRMYTGMIHDLTERKQREVESMERQRLGLALDKERELRDFKTRFISMMSHELRTPLASILLSSDMLRLYSDKSTPDEREMYLDNIRTQVDYLTTLIREIVSVSASDASRLTFSPQMTDVVALAQQIVEEYRLIYRQTHVVEFSAPQEPLVAMFDPKLMRQLLNNLISNAVKYTPEGARVSVELSRENGTLIIKVSDSGPGISEDDLPLLFEPFHRGANAKSVPGTGLGLTVVKQSVELHNGHIEVSTQPNNGTTFIVTLPFRVSPD